MISTLLFNGFLLLVLLLLPVHSNAQGHWAGVTGLKTEYLHNPQGIDMAHPRFSWIVGASHRGVEQKSYQIRVASNRSNLTVDKADMWETESVASDKSVNIAYDGKKLESDHTYYWVVRIQDQDSQWSDWSKVASFHTGLMEPSDWQGEWIGSPDTTISSPLFRKAFNLGKTVKSAHVFISGLGFYELYLNGGKVGNHKLDPGTTNFNKRALYVSYDVTNELNTGRNAIGVWLGNGYFRTSRDRPFKNYGDRPQLLLQMNITFNDGSKEHIVSNTSWKTADSPITENSIYDGEIYDARKEKTGWSKPGFNDNGWSDAVTLKVSRTRKVTAQLMPPIRVIKTIYPISMREPEKGVYVFDFGQNLTGWPELFVNGAQGQKVVMKTAEVTRKDMLQMMNKDTNGVVDTIDASPDRSAKARDIYILSGKPGTEVYKPRFTYQGFRYVQLEGYPGKPNLSSVAVQIVHSDVPQTGSFECSNGLFDRIHQNILWGQKSNLMSMPTDCSQRNERMGWMADAHLSAEEAMYNFDMAAFYTNWLNLIQDAQNPDGSVPDIVPDHKWVKGTKVGTPAWQVAYPLLIWYMHEYYNDDRVIEDHYESLKKWMDYMKSISDHYIITRGRGDWVPPKIGYAPIDGSIPITSTGYYYKSAALMSEMAGILGKKQDQAAYNELAEHIYKAFQKRFWNPQKRVYGSGSQTSNAFPLAMELVPKDQQQVVLDDLVNNIERRHDNHLWVGILGTKALIETLPMHGKTSVLYAITNQKTFPGWGYMVSKGSTTLWERWGGYRYFGPDMNSLNHIMFGSIDEFFYKDIAGIRSLAPGFKKILIRPYTADDMTYAKASVKTIRGEIISNWRKEEAGLTLEVTIPGNSTAVIDIPKSDPAANYSLTESGITIWKNNSRSIENVEEIKDIRDTGKYIEVRAGAGTYIFDLNSQPTE